MSSFLMLLAALCVNQAADTGDKDPTVLEKIARVGVEKIVGFVLETNVSLKSVSLDPKDGNFELNGLSIANPKGFTSENAMELEKVRLEADIKSLFSNEPFIKLVNVGGATVNAELNVSRGINLKKFLDSASRFGGGKGGGKSGKPSEKRWRIEKALLEKSSLNIISPLSLGQKQTKSLDHVEFSIMGADGKGATTDEAIGQILDLLLKESGLTQGEGLGAVVSPLLDALK